MRHPSAQEERLPPEVRRAALRMYVDGINLRRTARLVGVAPQTVVN